MKVAELSLLWFSRVRLRPSGLSSREFLRVTGRNVVSGERGERIGVSAGRESRECAANRANRLKRRFSQAEEAVSAAQGNRVTVSTFVSPFCTRHRANIKRLTLIEPGRGSRAFFLLNRRPYPTFLSVRRWRKPATVKEPLDKEKEAKNGRIGQRGGRGGPGLFANINSSATSVSRRSMGRATPHGSFSLISLRSFALLSLLSLFPFLPGRR